MCKVECAMVIAQIKEEKERRGKKMKKKKKKNLGMTFRVITKIILIITKIKTKTNSTFFFS